MKEYVSIVVPVYKVEQYLDRCVNSIICQTYKKLEIILVDDGSPDECPQMCEKWAAKDSRVKVIHKKNGGLSDARNKGIDIATGEYLLFVDSDDYLELDACEKMVNALKNTDADFTVGVIREIHTDRIVYQRHSAIEKNICYLNSDFLIKSINKNEWYAPVTLNLYKLSFWKENSLRFVVGILHEDMEILPKIYLAANKINYLDYPFYNYEIRENSIMTSQNNKIKFNSIIFIYNSWKKQFDEIQNYNMRKKLYGVLIKHYLYSCRELKITKWLIPGIDAFFSLHYALNMKEKIKVIAFAMLPDLYIKI